jgi:predicted ferric reductase
MLRHLWISTINRLALTTFALVQRLLGAAFIVGAVHTVVHGTADASTMLTVYVAVLTAAACASLGYRLSGGSIDIGRHRYRVDGVHRFDGDVVEAVMSPVGRALEFQAGQFVYATVHQTGLRTESLTSRIGPPGAAARPALPSALCGDVALPAWL